MSKKVYAVLLAGMFASSGAIASPAKHDPIIITGTGNLSCGVWVEARNTSKAAQQNLHVQWVAGYFVGHNYYRSQPISQVNADFPTIELWLDTYCRNNPLHGTFFAAAALVQELGGSKALHPWKR